MKKNIGNLERVIRLAASILLIMCFFKSPLDFAIRIFFLVPGIYMALAATSGFCLGYKFLGKSTCKIPEVKPK